MDSRTFLDAFGHIANAPGGMNQLRFMIYQLAVTGALTPRLDHNQSTTELLKSVEAKRQGLITSNRYKRLIELEAEPVVVPQGIQLPETWEWSRLLDVGEINPRNSGSDDDVAAFLPMRGVPAAHRGNALFELKKWGNLKKGYTHFQDGDVVLAKITPCFENGKAGVIPSFRDGVAIGGGTTELLVFRPFHPDINADYVYLFLRSPMFRVEGETRMTGTAGQKRLPTDYFATKAFPLPPSEEQAQIVRRVDELMALCAQLEQQQKARRDIRTRTRKALIQITAGATAPSQVVSAWGKLTENFADLFSSPSDLQDLRNLVCDLAIRGMLHSGSSVTSPDAVKSLLLDIAARKDGKGFANAFQPQSDFDLPHGWRWVILEDLLQSSESGWSPKCDAQARRGGEYGVLKVSAVTWGKFRPDENKRLPFSMRPRLECQVKPGDFLITRANTSELVARSVIVPDDCPAGLLMSDKIIRLTFADDLLKPWINLVNNSAFSRRYYKSKATGTSDSMRNVSREAIHGLPVPLPPLEVQNALIAVVSRLAATCEELASQLEVKDRLGSSVAQASVSSIIGIAVAEEEAELIAPQTELFASIRLGTPPAGMVQAPLASILVRHSGALSAKDLWQRFGGEIDGFYAQLKREVARGWIVEPEVAEMRERESA